jgi:CHRD domain
MRIARREESTTQIRLKHPTADRLMRDSKENKLINMNRHFRRATVASALALASIAAQAATVNLKATLKASSEVPPNASGGTGMLTATLDTTTREFTYHVTFDGLTGAATAAHFHGPASPGANGGPQVPVKMSPIVSPIDGTTTLTPEQAKDLLAGKWYINIHTATNPNGEIRGQVLKAK